MLNRKELTKRTDRLRQTCARYEGAKKRKGEWVNTCVTCGQTVKCDKANGGHFIPRACLPLRWDERNVHCQCVRCNLYKNGAYIEYSQWFIKKYGKDIFDRYVSDYKNWQQGKVETYRIDELRSIYDYWLNEGRKLEEKVGKLFPKSWRAEAKDYLE